MVTTSTCIYVLRKYQNHLVYGLGTQCFLTYRSTDTEQHITNFWCNGPFERRQESPKLSYCICCGKHEQYTLPSYPIKLKH